MGLFDIFKKENKENKKAIFISNAGGMIITKSLLEGKSKLKWIFRENSTNAADNGWRAIGDTDTQIMAAQETTTPKTASLRVYAANLIKTS